MSRSFAQISVVRPDKLFQKYNIWFMYFFQGCPVIYTEAMQNLFNTKIHQLNMQAPNKA